MIFFILIQQARYNNVVEVYDFSVIYKIPGCALTETSFLSWYGYYLCFLCLDQDNSCAFVFYSRICFNDVISFYRTHGSCKATLRASARFVWGISNRLYDAHAIWLVGYCNSGVGKITSPLWGIIKVVSIWYYCGQERLACHIPVKKRWSSYSRRLFNDRLFNQMRHDMGSNPSLKA